ncbi:hypothetical protein AVEN_12648-1 [Araneus ventricosus]|uniref:RNA-directed DNA polymerase n=1 Tax=Araneus ventricosus TaxID=182803 RepID=A0A4Y2ACI5_ARAVE|nr:hypothetical protein AVEN_12648-1 [Araneus ventricosus]
MEWFEPLGIKLGGVYRTEIGIEFVLEEFKDVFSEDLRSYKGPAISLPIDPKYSACDEEKDLAQANLQLRVDDASAEAQTIVTHKEAFKVNRLQFGVNVAPGLFQDFLEDSLKGIPGYVLSHLMPDDREAPIAYASRTLTPTERNYSQLDKEALRIIAGVKQFHYFLYWHTFTLVTDHQPLPGLFNKMKLTPDILSPRMLQTDIPSPPEVLFLEELHNTPVKADEISQATLRDPVLSRVLNWVLKGCPESAKECRNFYLKRHELSVHKICLLWGNRVVIPEVLRGRVLVELHISHPGIEKLKSLVYCYVWWSKIEEDIENHLGLCEQCQQTRHAPPRAPVHPWEVTTKP